MEDLVVGLLVDAIGDLLVVLITKTGLVGGVVNFWKCGQHWKENDIAMGEYKRLVTCLSAKP